MFLLVDQACASACEIESYGFSQVPGMVVVGQYPTSGIEAEVSRGQFLLPEGMSLQMPTGRFVLPDGSIFLEGKGVQPTERVPIDEEIGAERHRTRLSSGSWSWQHSNKKRCPKRSFGTRCFLNNKNIFRTLGHADHRLRGQVEQRAREQTPAAPRPPPRPP